MKDNLQRQESSGVFCDPMSSDIEILWAIPEGEAAQENLRTTGSDQGRALTSLEQLSKGMALRKTRQSLVGPAMRRD